MLATRHAVSSSAIGACILYRFAGRRPPTPTDETFLGLFVAKSRNACAMKQPTSCERVWRLKCAIIYVKAIPERSSVNACKEHFILDPFLM